MAPSSPPGFPHGPYVSETSWGVPAGGAGSPGPGRRSRRPLLAIPAVVVVAAVIAAVVVVTSSGGGHHPKAVTSAPPAKGTSTGKAPPVLPGVKAALINDTVLYDPTHPTVVNGRGYQPLAVDQTRDCSSVVTKDLVAVMNRHNCLAILRGLFVNAGGDVIVNQDVIVLDNPADAAAVNTAINSPTAGGIYAPKVALTAVHAYPGINDPTAKGPDAAPLAPAPASAGTAGAVQASDPGDAKGGHLAGTIVQNQFVLYNDGSYDNGLSSAVSDQRLQRATGDVRYAVSDPLLAIEIQQGAQNAQLVAIKFDF